MLEVGSLSKEYYRVRRARDDEYAAKETEAKESEKKEQRHGLDIQAKQGSISIKEGEAKQLEAKLREEAPPARPPHPPSTVSSTTLPPLHTRPMSTHSAVSRAPEPGVCAERELRLRR